MFTTFTILVFMTVISVMGAMFFHRQEIDARVVRGRLQQRASRERVLRIERDSRYSVMPMLNAVLRHLNVTRRLELLLYQAGLSTRVGVLVLATAALAMGGYLGAIMLTHRLWLGVVTMLAILPLPLLYVVHRKHRRMQAFAEGFPDALDLLVSALRAGLSFTAALQMAAEETPEPVRSELAITLEEHALGMDLKDCLVNLCQRVDSLDLRFFTTAIVLQRESGGNLAEILQNTSDLIRDRFRLMGDIKTFTTQGRLTGAVLVCLPLAVGLFTFIASPKYMGALLVTEGGRRALMMAGAMQVLGMLIMRKIVQIKV